LTVRWKQHYTHSLTNNRNKHHYIGDLERGLWIATLAIMQKMKASSLDFFREIGLAVKYEEGEETERADQTRVTKP
jgi:hypothetical protein